MRKGWFAIPGEQEGDRTLEEQMTGLEPALLMARERSVLDLGCAEGLIALEFAAAGAEVYGIELVDAEVAIARKLAKERQLNARFDRGRVEDVLPRKPEEFSGPFDIVLCLSILNKLDPPEPYFAALGRWVKRGGLAILRLPAPVYVNTHVKEFEPRDARQMMTAAGFGLEREASGPRGEWVSYWRR